MLSIELFSHDKLGCGIGDHDRMKLDGTYLFS